jgi:hypothetical protein
LFFHLLLINYFTNSSLNNTKRLSICGVISYDQNYFQAPLTTLDTTFLKQLIADHKFDIHAKAISASVNLVKQGVISEVEQKKLESLPHNLQYFKVHLGLDYFHPIFRDLRRMDQKVSTLMRMEIGLVRTVFKMGYRQRYQKE